MQVNIKKTAENGKSINPFVVLTVLLFQSCNDIQIKARQKRIYMLTNNKDIF